MQFRIPCCNLTLDHSSELLLSLTKQSKVFLNICLLSGLRNIWPEFR